MEKYIIHTVRCIHFKRQKIIYSIKTSHLHSIAHLLHIAWHKTGSEVGFQVSRKEFGLKLRLETTETIQIQSNGDRFRQTSPQDEKVF